MSRAARHAGGEAPLRVVIVGRGRVGRSLAASARAAGAPARVVTGRGESPIPPADLVVLCVPDGSLLDVSARLRASLTAARAVVHTAGVLSPDHLAGARARGWSVGQAHPLAAVARPDTTLAGATLLVGGDELAVLRTEAFARRIGMRPLVLPNLDRRLWHAVAALVANGASTLASLGAEALIRGGVPASAAHAGLAALVRSVAENVDAVGTPEALTGPVRRGDVETVRRHMEALAAADASGALIRIYGSLALAQVELARALGEADQRSLRKIGEAARDPRVAPRRR